MYGTATFNGNEVLTGPDHKTGGGGAVAVAAGSGKYSSKTTRT